MQWTVPSTTLSLGHDQHKYNLFKRFCGPWLSQNMQCQEKHCSDRFIELPSKERKFTE